MTISKKAIEWTICCSLCHPSPVARPVPYPFLFDQLLLEGVTVKPMFGHHAVYLGEKIVLFLIDKPGERDNGVGVATTAVTIPLLVPEFRSMRHLYTYGPSATDWRLIPADAPDFEADVVRACELICERDPRIGRLPKGSAKRAPETPTAKKKKKPAPGRSR